VDGVRIPIRSGGQLWLVSWHPPPEPSDGIPRDASGRTETGRRRRPRTTSLHRFAEVNAIIRDYPRLERCASISRRMKPSPILTGMRNLSRPGEPRRSHTGATRRPEIRTIPAPMTARQGSRGAKLWEPLPSGLPGLTPTPPERFCSGGSRPTLSDRPRHPIRAWESRGRRFIRPSRQTLQVRPGVRKASRSALTLPWSAAVKFGLSGLVPLAEGPGDISHERR
jgi:hypothetical protein